MKTPWALVTLLFGLSSVVHAIQAKTPERALEEIANADKPEVIVRHLPEAVEKSIDHLPKPQKQQVLDKLLSMKSEHLGGCTVRRATDTDGWEIIGEDGESAGKIKVVNVFISGLDALISLQLQSEDNSQMFMVAMRLEGDDWRIDDFGPWHKTNLRLRQLVHQPSDAEKNESATRATLLQIVMALRGYWNLYRNIGFPSRLDLLAGHAGQEASQDHAGLLDTSFAAEPLIMNGYEFRYVLTRRGGFSSPAGTFHGYQYFDPGAFEITATPVEFGKTGARNYFTNQSGMITSTLENRPATVDDPVPEDDD
jgi:hypothetical protein